jgi:hypothetical protein
MPYPPPAEVRRLRVKRARIDAAKADNMRQMVLALDLPPEPENRILAALDAATEGRLKGWEFVMVNVDNHFAIVSHLFEHSKRPKLAVKLWSLLFTVTNHSTGRVIATQAEMAEALDARVPHVSEALGELVKLNAVIRQRHGRAVSYTINPNVATSLSGPQRALAQQEAGNLRLVS